jgi:hypothetical protein
MGDEEAAVQQPADESDGQGATTEEPNKAHTEGDDSIYGGGTPNGGGNGGDSSGGDSSGGDSSGGDAKSIYGG